MCCVVAMHSSIHVPVVLFRTGSNRLKRSPTGGNDDIRIVGGYEPSRRPFMAFIEVHAKVRAPMTVRMGDIEARRG